MASYLNKGHILYTDNCYTSPSLSVYLAQNNTGSCKTVKKSRKHFSRFEAVTQGRSKIKQNCINLLAVKCKDRRDVHIITAAHTGNLVKSGKNDFQTKQLKLKSDCIVDYNKNMRLVDKADMQISSMECMRKSMKCYKKLFFHLVDIVMLNCYNMYVKNWKKSSLRKFKQGGSEAISRNFWKPSINQKG